MIDIYMSYRFSKDTGKNIIMHINLKLVALYVTEDIGNVIWSYKRSSFDEKGQSMYYFDKLYTNRVISESVKNVHVKNDKISIRTMQLWCRMAYL